MLRKLMLMELEAVRRHSIECAVTMELSAVGASDLTGGIGGATPSLPQRFGVCASRYDS